MNKNNDKSQDLSKEKASSTACVMLRLREIEKYIDKAWTLTIELELQDNKGVYHQNMICNALHKASKQRRALEMQLTT